MFLKKCKTCPPSTRARIRKCVHKVPHQIYGKISKKSLKKKGEEKKSKKKRPFKKCLPKKIIPQTQNIFDCFTVSRNNFT